MARRMDSSRGRSTQSDGLAAGVLLDLGDPGKSLALRTVASLRRGARPRCRTPSGHPRPSPCLRLRRGAVRAHQTYRAAPSAKRGPMTAGSGASAAATSMHPRAGNNRAPRAGPARAESGRGRHWASPRRRRPRRPDLAAPHLLHPPPSRRALPTKSCSARRSAGLTIGPGTSTYPAGGRRDRHQGALGAQAARGQLRELHPRAEVRGRSRAWDRRRTLAAGPPDSAQVTATQPTTSANPYESRMKWRRGRMIWRS